MNHLTRADAARAFSGIIVCLVLNSAVAQAQSPSAQTSATTAADTVKAAPATQRADSAALMVHGRRITVFRSSLGASTPTERADMAARRIAAIAERGQVEQVGFRRVSEGILVSVGDSPVFTITEGDVDPDAGVNLEQAAAETSVALRQAMREEVQERSLARVLWGVGMAVLATLLFSIVVRAIGALRRLILRRLVTREARRVRRIAIAGFTLFHATQLLTLLRKLVEASTWIATMFAAYLWLTFVLTRFAYSREWGEALGSYLLATMKGLALGALGAIPGLFTVVLIFLAVRFLTRVVGAFFRAAEVGEVTLTWLHADTAQPTRRIIVAMLWLFAVVVAYPYLPGSQSDIFKGVTVFVGLLLSIGSSGVVNQAMSGLVLMYARALRPGEYVRIGDVEGTVMALTMLSTKIHTPKGEEITIPNAVVVTSHTRNYSRLAAEGGVYAHTTVTIGYDAAWRQVHALLIMAAERTPGTLREPPAFVLQTGLSDFYPQYQLNVALEVPSSRARTLSALHANIQDCFNEYGVQIMSPHYRGDPASPITVPLERWHAPPAELDARSIAPSQGASVEAPVTTTATTSGSV